MLRMCNMIAAHHFHSCNNLFSLFKMQWLTLEKNGSLFLLRILSNIFFLTLSYITLSGLCPPVNWPESIPILTQKQKINLPTSEYIERTDTDIQCWQDFGVIEKKPDVVFDVQYTLDFIKTEPVFVDLLRAQDWFLAWRAGTKTLLVEQARQLHGWRNRFLGINSINVYKYGLR